ncbi:MAG: membrane protein insertase YidC [Nitrospirota bacterium]
MEKRALIAIALAFIILLVYQFFFVKPEPQKVPKSLETERKAPLPPPIKPAETRKILPGTPSFEEKEIRVETDLYLAVFTNKGGTLKYYEIKKYKDEFGKNVVLLHDSGNRHPLGIGPNYDFELAGSKFRVSEEDLILGKNQQSGSLVFENTDSDLLIKRTYTFHNQSYRIDIKDEISGLPDYWITLGTDFGIHKKDTSVHIGPVILKDSDRIELDPRKLDQPRVYTGALRWIAQEDKYFFASLVPVTEMEEVRVWKQNGTALMAFNGKPGINTFVLYAGPKEYDSLKALNVGLEHVVDFGFFSIIAVPLFWVLKFFYTIIGNYGWAIVLLTLIIRIPFIPLINKSQRSMKKMQELQPRMAELREKYKKDPQRLQREMMELYKKYKVNPVGGCLPIILQIPIFFALYKILLIAIELRGAPFMLWINDLSAPDTLFGHIPAWFPLIGGFAVGPLPILMGITMIIQQKMTPTSMDPTQNKIMMLMPIIFTFLFLNFASGLVLYWLMNNVFSIIQQFYANKKIAKESR